jgi:hypothetical protein
MKKFITLLAILLVGMIGMAQSDYSHSMTTSGDASGTFWNNSDTLTDGQTLDALIRVKSDKVMDIRVQVVFNELSGASTGTLTFLGSNDGVTYIDTGDSITAALTANGSIWLHATHFNYSYAKVLLTTAGTETSCAKAYYSFRKD